MKIHDFVVQEEGESPPSTQRSRPSQNDDPSLCANPLKLLVVLASSIGGDRLFLGIVPLCRPRPIRIRDERERLVTASPVMTKCRGPSWGRNNYPENGLVNPPRRDTRALGPAGMFEGKAPPRLAAHKSRPHAHLGPMRCEPAYLLCKCGV